MLWIIPSIHLRAGANGALLHLNLNADSKKQLMVRSLEDRQYCLMFLRETLFSVLALLLVRHFDLDIKLCKETQ